MKIGILLAKPPGYSETFFNSKIEGLKANGFEIILFCQESTQSFSACPVKILPKKHSNPIILGLSLVKTFFKLIPFFKRIVEWYKLEKKISFLDFFTMVYLNAPILKEDLDWLHFGFTTMALKRESLANAIGAKMAVSFRGYDINIFPKKNPNCFEKTWSYVDCVHSISYYLVKEAKKLGLKESTPYKLITPAVDFRKIHSNNILQTDNDLLKIVTIARLTWVKGLDLLIEAASIIHKKNINFEWVVIGDGTRREIERYSYYIYEKGLLGKVKLIGKKTHSETLELLNDAEVYVQTSYNEGFCNAVLEAQALGKLCIAYDTGGLSENIIHNKTGWLIELANTENLAEKIIEVSNLTEDQKEKISYAAQQRVKDDFNIEKQQENFVEFYKI